MTADRDAGERPDDPAVEALLVIAGELRAIRQELERLDSDGDELDEDVDEYECRSCDAVLAGGSAARQHAMDDHGAPAADWMNLYR